MPSVIAAARLDVEREVKGSERAEPRVRAAARLNVGREVKDSKRAEPREGGYNDGLPKAKRPSPKIQDSYLLQDAYDILLCTDSQNAMAVGFDMWLRSGSNEHGKQLVGMRLLLNRTSTDPKLAWLKGADGISPQHLIFAGIGCKVLAMPNGAGEFRKLYNAIQQSMSQNDKCKVHKEQMCKCCRHVWHPAFKRIKHKSTVGVLQQLCKSKQNKQKRGPNKVCILHRN